MSRKYATIHLGYFKQGNDLEGCIEKNPDDTVNVKKTLKNHVLLLESVIDHLKQIDEKIPEINDCTIDGDTHFISIEGSERIINDLVSNNLAEIDEYMNEELEELENSDNLDDLEELSDSDKENEFEEEYQEVSNSNINFYL